MKSLRFEVTPEMKRALAKYSKQTGRTQSEIARHAISRYLEFQTGEMVEWRMEWGGPRDVEKSNGKS